VKLTLAVLIAALLASCAPSAPARCDFTIAQEIAFSSESSADMVVVRAIGASCDKATLLYTINDAEERPIWVWAAPLSRAFGDDFPADEPERLQDFLRQWAEPDVASTADAPAWRSLEAAQTTLDQFTYEDIRARDLPMLCHYSGTARQACVFWEPAAGGAGLLYERDVQEAQE
jgi:hypothetical protein